jgi:parvulin-like peptidyl-prolyl isomerase
MSAATLRTLVWAAVAATGIGCATTAESPTPSGPTPPVARRPDPEPPTKADPPAGPPSAGTETPEPVQPPEMTGPPAPPTRRDPPPVEPPPPVASPRDRLVVVGDTALTKQQLIDRLLLSQGPKVLDLMIEIELARQMAAERGVRIDEDDRESFIIQNLRNRLGGKGLALGDDQLRAIAQEIRRRREDSDLLLELLYYLDRTARKTVRVSDDDLRKEFEKQHGAKVRFRCIVVNNYAAAGVVLDRIGKGEPFAAVAEKASQDAPTAKQGGMCDPSPVKLLPDPVQSELARLKNGDVSRPVNIADRWYLFQLIGRDPAADVRFEQVAEQLRRSVAEEKVRDGIALLKQEIRRLKAEKVTFLDERFRHVEKPSALPTP